MLLKWLYCSVFLRYKVIPATFWSYRVHVRYHNNTHKCKYVHQIFCYISNKMQHYTVYLFLETALHVSGGISTHHQEHTQPYLQYLALVKVYCYLLLWWRSWNSHSNSFTIAAGNSTLWQVPDAVDTVVCAPDDGWRYHPKHVEQFPQIDKLCNIAACWIYIRTHLRCTDPWMLNVHQS